MILLSNWNIIAINLFEQSNAAKANVDRMTDTSKYTGSHKERFDKSGKGLGMEGRKNVADAAGYVSGYKNKDTYDKNH